MLKKITIHDVAREVGLSIGTVSGILNGRNNFADTTVKRVWDVAHRLNYTPSTSARSLRQGCDSRREKTSIILHIACSSHMPPLIGSETEHAFFLSSMEAQKRNFSSISYAYSEEKAFCCPPLLNGLVAGALVGTPHLDVIKSVSEKVPTVLMDLPFMEGTLRIPQVNADWHYGSLCAFQHLYALGHRNISLLQTMDKDAPVNYKKAVQSICSAAQECGVNIVPEYSFRADFSYQNNMVLLSRYAELLKRGVAGNAVTAVFSLDAVFLKMLLPILQNAGLKVPEDLSLISHLLAAEPEPDVTTVFMPREKIISCSMDILENMMNGKDERNVEILLRPEISHCKTLARAGKAER